MQSSAGPFSTAVSKIFPRKFARAMGALLGLFWFDVLHLRRKVIRQNLDLAFPGKDTAWKNHVGRQSVIKLCQNFTELFTIPAMNQNWLRKHGAYDGWDHYEKARAKGKGLFILSMHMGTYDVASSMISMRGDETFLISKNMKNKVMNDFWFSLRGAQGMKYIPAHSDKTAFDILKAMKKKANVIFVLDQFMGKPFGIPTTFFGQSTGTAYGLALFVLKTGAPVVPMYSIEGKDGKIHLIAEPEIDTAPFLAQNEGDKDAAVAALTQKFNDVMEQIVRKYPEEWLWVHRRWKKFE